MEVGDEFRSTVSNENEETKSSPKLPVLYGEVKSWNEVLKATRKVESYIELQT